MVTLETERLVLRHFREDDFEAYARINADPEVMRFLGGQVMSRLEAWRHMAMLVGHWQLRGYGHWAVVEKATGAFAGRLGFHNPEGWPAFEIGWTLAREHWGKGYATEGATAALDYVFTEMKREHVISLIHPDNVNSIRVAERLGERLEGKTGLFGIEVSVYSLDRETWLASR
ncbi:MAG: GNAT family N-acetyltransferase [Pyrinomonadaceae bacterium]